MNSDDERKENEKYKAFINSQLNENPDLFCALRREKQLDYLFPKIKEELTHGSSNLLDLCCGYGRLIYFLKDEFPNLKIHGIDYLESLIEQGRKHFKGHPHVSFEVNNAFDISKHHSKEFDLTIIHKTLSWLPYYENILSEAFKVTKKKIFITSLFWDGDIDFISKLYKNAKDNDGETFSYINTYSLPKFKQYCTDLGARHVNSENMNIDIDLPRNSDTNLLQTFTVTTATKERLEFTGPLLLNWKLIEIVL